MATRDIYAPRSTDDLSFGPHGVYSLGRITKSRRAGGNQLREQMERLHAIDAARTALNTGVETNDNTVTRITDERRTELEQIVAQTESALDELRERCAPTRIDDLEDAIAFMLCELIVLMLDNTPDDLAAKLYADVDADLLGIDDLTATVEYIDDELEKRTAAKNA